jgi:predicted metal-dependent enzyme (double-stranded beta helix superfamily)
MALTPTPALASPAIDQLSPAELLRTASLFASDPDLPFLVDPGEEESRWVELDSSPYLNIWLLSWPVGTHNEWHDHGESAGAFQVVRGTLLEQTLEGNRREFRTIVAGQGRSFGQNHIHQFANVRSGTALSVHVYAPRLVATMRYAITPTGLKSRAVGEAELDW